MFIGGICDARTTGILLKVLAHSIAVDVVSGHSWVDVRSSDVVMPIFFSVYLFIIHKLHLIWGLVEVYPMWVAS